MTLTSGNKFCSACGNALLETAVVCPKCGSPTPQYRPQVTSQAKSKTTAVVLAVFLGPWSWLYTYKLNAYKFWLTMSFQTLTFIYLISAFISMQIKVSAGTAVYDDATAVAASSLFFSLLSSAFWLWALLENAIKSQDFYANYDSK
jgi:uncharacterized membrane protein YvbJ